MGQDSHNDDDLQQISAVQARHANALLNYANVVGVGIGIAKKDGQITNEMALVVMVSQKLPVAQLASEDVLPHQLEGVRVDVQETGGFSADNASPAGDFSAS